MTTLRGAVRLMLVVLLLAAGIGPVILLSLIPVRHKGARLGARLTQTVARGITAVFGVHWVCTDPARMAYHRGLIFPNHSSLLDSLVLLCVTPARYLGAAEVRRIPIIGWFGEANEAVFVDRKNRSSRRAARSSIAVALRTDPFPPIAIFPEGRLGPGDRLNPFRYGAFELAVQNGVAFLPCAIHYSRPDITTWYGGSRNESLLAAAWRLATFDGRIDVTLTPLEVMRPTPADDVAMLAAITQRAIEQALGFPPAPLTLDEVDPARWEREAA